MQYPNLVRVEGWSLPRRISVAKDSVALEVVKRTCRCDTCFARLRYVEKQLLQNGVTASIFEVEGSVAVLIPMNEGDEPCQAVSKAIGRGIVAIG